MLDLEREQERAASTGRARLERQLAAECLRDPARQGEAQARAPVLADDGAVALAERLEKPRLRVFRHADPLVLDLDREPEPGLLQGPRAHLNADGPEFREFDGVAHEVD